MRLFSAILIVLSVAGGVFAEQVSLEKYLKSRFFGMTLVYTEADGLPMGQGSPMDLSKADLDYYMTLQDQDGEPVTTRVVFEISKQETLRQNNQPTNIREKELREQYNVEKFVNAAIRPILGDDDGEDSNLTSPLPEQRLEELNSGEEAMIWDRDASEKKKGRVVIIDDRILLSDRTPIVIRFERL